MKPICLTLVWIFWILLLGCGAAKSKSSPVGELEARDTIVAFGEYQVLVPRSASCEWRVVDTSEAPHSIVIFGCEPNSISVRTSVTLYIGLAEADEEAMQQFRWFQNLELQQNCSMELLSEGNIETKHWTLCKGNNAGDPGIDYHLHVNIETKNCYLHLVHSINPDEYDAYGGQEEIDRVINTVQVWHNDE